MPSRTDRSTRCPPRELPTAAQLRSELDLDSDLYGKRAGAEDAAADLERVRAVLGAQSARLVNFGDRDLKASEVRERHAIAGEIAALARLADEIESRLGIDPPGFERKLRHGRPDSGSGTPGSGPMFTLADGSRIRGTLATERFADGMPGGAGREEPDDALARLVLHRVTGNRALLADAQLSQTTSPASDGGFFTGPQISSRLIDQARAVSVLIRAGAITLPLTGSETRVVKVNTDPTAGWHNELEALTNTEVSLGAVTLIPKTLGAVVDLSQELVDDAVNSVETVQRVLAEAVAVQLDRSLFRGVEAGRPFTGVLDDPDVSVTDVGTNGVAPSATTGWDWYIDATEDVRTNNGEPDVYLEHPRTTAQFGKLKDTTNQPLRPPQEVSALRRLVTTQMPVDQVHGTASDATSVVVGNFTSAFVILGVRSQFRVETSREAGNAFENLGVKVRIWGRFDLAIGRPTHLARIEGIVP